MPAAPLLQVSNLFLRYGKFEALKGIHFTVHPGEIVGYLGPNGAGKSSTVKVLTGLLTPGGGSVEVCGHNVANQTLAAQACIGYVPESAPAYSLLTGLEYLSLVAGLYDVPSDKAEANIKMLIETFDMQKVAPRLIHTYSKGQRQKIVLCAALLHEPQVLILDEPLDGLDVDSARKVKEIVTGLAARGRAVLFCSHTLEIVQKLCTRIIILNEGRVVADQPTEEILNRSQDHNLESVFSQLTKPDKGNTDIQQVIAAL
ncbi:MAG: ABC transporter ATP-binding protein [Saprospiraceae bacterium]|nr:ABC transporter ATP-binding protein [Saprospiraceae bacterium]